MTELLPVSPLLIRTAMESGWFDNPERNLRRGFGAGPEGIERATQAFLAASENGMLGLYEKSRAVGWLTVSQPERGVAELSVFLLPDDYHSGRKAVHRVVKMLDEQGMRRIAVRVPETDTEAIRFWRSCGFTREGKSWALLEVDGRDVDTVNLVLTRAKLRKREKRS